MGTPYMDGCGHGGSSYRYYGGKSTGRVKNPLVVPLHSSHLTVKSDVNVGIKQGLATFSLGQMCPINAKTAICDLLGTMVRVFGGVQRYSKRLKLITTTRT